MQKYKEIVLSHIVEYCKLEKYPYQSFGKSLSILCPFCRDKSLTAQRVSNTALLHCVNPGCPRGNEKFTLISVIKKTNKIQGKLDNLSIVEYLKTLLKVKIITPKDESKVNKLFTMYEKSNWSLVPIKRNDKIPVEKNWTNEEHKDRREWWQWLNSGLNLGVRTGNVSNLTIIDVDQKPIPKEIKEIMGEPLIAESTKGYHLFYSYDKDLSKGRAKELKTDIENNNGQVVIAPSIIDEIPRKWLNDNEIISIPNELKQLLIKAMGKVKEKSTLSEELREEIQMGDFNLDLVKKGEGRSDFLIRMGGLFRKQFNYDRTRRIVQSLNKHLCNPPIPIEGMEATIFNSIEKYCSYDDEEMIKQILDYLKEAGQVEKRDIERVIIGNYKEGETKAKLDKAMAYLLREDLIQKRGRFIEMVKRLEWKTSLLEGVKPLNFKVPYFDDLMYFAWGDVIIIGGKPSVGKTHIAMNIIKQLVEQKIVPKYISLESGSRFKKIALQIGLVEGDFEYAKCKDPTKIELEDGAITIIDWLLPSQYKYTDQIIGHFNEQLEKHGGLLFLFVQLRKSNGEWFAKDLIEFFPALAVKYFWDDDDGVFGHYEICKVRESQRKKRLGSIPCQFAWESKILNRIDSLPEKIKTVEEPEQILSNGNEEEEIGRKEKTERMMDKIDGNSKLREKEISTKKSKKNKSKKKTKSYYEE